AEARVESTIAVVASQGEVIAMASDRGHAREYDLAVGLDRLARGQDRTVEADDDPAAAAEAGVEAAITVVAGQGKFVAASEPATVLSTGNDDFAVDLDRHAA